jgi:hypothetical protein
MTHAITTATATHEQAIAADFAAGINAVAQVVHGAQGRARRLLIEEVEHTDWGKEVAIAVADAIVFSASNEADGVSAESQYRHTILVALDEHGARLAMVHCREWYAQKLLPAALRWAREAQGIVSWTRAGQVMLVRDGRFALAAPAPARSLADNAQRLSAHGWVVTATEQGFNATRAVNKRDWVSMVIVVTFAVLLFPVAAVIALWMVAKKLTTGRWPRDEGVVAPWQRAEDRIAIDCAPGRLRVVRTQAGKTVMDRQLDRATLSSAYAEGAIATGGSLLLIESDRVTSVAMGLRGELARNDDQRQCADALLEAITAVWMR